MKHEKNLKIEKQTANNYQLSEPAKLDLKEIWTHFAEYNQNSAEKLLKEFAKKFTLIANNQKIGRNHDELILNLRSFPHKNYLVFYFPIENGIEIYRVIHGAMDIDNLFDEIIEGLKP